MMLSAKKLELRGTVLVSERREENAALNETALSRVERYRCVLHRVRARWKLLCAFSKVIHFTCSIFEGVKFTLLLHKPEDDRILTARKVSR